MALHRSHAAHAAAASRRRDAPATLARERASSRSSCPRPARGSCSSTACSRRRSRRRLRACGVRVVHARERAVAARDASLEPHLAQLAAFDERPVRGAQHRAPARRRGRASCRGTPRARRRCHLLYRRDAAGHRRPIRAASSSPKPARECTRRSRTTSALHDGAYFTNAVTEIARRRERAACATSACSAKAPARSTSRTCAVRARAATRRYTLADDRARRAPLALRPERRCRRRRRRTAQIDGLALIGEPPARRHAHADRSRAAERPQPRSCTRRSSDGAAHAVFNGKILRAPGRAAHRFGAAEPQPAALRQGARRHQAAARDLRRRREVRARRDRRPARRRAAVLSAGAAACPSARRAIC